MGEEKRLYKKISLMIETLCIIAMFLITYAIVIRQMGYGYSDFNAHAQWAVGINGADFGELIRNCAYPLWHILVAAANGVLMIPVNHASALITALFNVLLYCVVLGAFQKELDAWIDVLIPLGAMMVCILAAFYIPWYNEGIYKGQIAANIWHNPTNMCVKPFMVLAFLQMQSIFEDYGNNKKIHKKKWIALSALLLLGSLAKPSCVQVLVPGGGYLLHWIAVKGH